MARGDGPAVPLSVIFVVFVLFVAFVIPAPRRADPPDN